MRYRFPLQAALVIILLLSCPQRLLASDQPPQSFHEWDIIEVATARSLPFEEWLAELSTKEIIYLGEEHRNRWHVEAALKLLHGLLTRKRRPTIALEMFGWDGQEGLNRYLADSQAPRDRFLQESRWEQNWGGPFEEYEPLIAFAREQQLPVLALNPPLPLVRNVAAQGLARANAGTEMSRWGMRDEVVVDDPAYRNVILKQLRLCHSGLAEEVYQRMYEASLFRDEGMAKTITESLRAIQAGATPSTGPIVSYTGGGHIQYHIPVPNRVRRRGGSDVKQVTVYLVSFDSQRQEEVRELLQGAIADYLWLTPVSSHGTPKRCR